MNENESLFSDDRYAIGNMDIYEYASVINRAINKSHLPAFRDWSRETIAKHVSTAVGTQVELDVELQKLEQKLKKDYAAFKDAERAQITALENLLIAETEVWYSTDKLDKRIREMIWERAWEEGHSSGYRDVVNSYHDVADFVLRIVKFDREARA